MLTVSVQAKDEHVFTCTDSNGGPEIQSGTAAATHFTWVKNGQQIFNRTFTDGYSRSRNSYVTFLCSSKNIIQYKFYSCDTEGVQAYCPTTNMTTENSDTDSRQTEEEEENAEEVITEEEDDNTNTQTESTEPEGDIKLIVDQRKVTTNATLVDGDDYRFISHYVLKSASANTVTVKGLYFITEADENDYVSSTESSAAAQYEYVFLGPDGELINGVTTNDGRLYFNLSAFPINVNNSDINVGIGAKGIVAQKQGQNITSEEVDLTASRPDVFSRGAAGLKMSHFNPQQPLFEPSLSVQPFYRMKVENISPSSPAAFARGSLDLRLLGMQKQGGADLETTDFSLAELDTSGNVISSLPAQITKITAEHSDNKSISLRFDISNFTVPAESFKVIEFRIANITNDDNQEGDDDGLAIAMKTETFTDGSKYGLSDLNDANWVWSDLSNPGSDWRSGINLELRRSALVMKD